MCRLAFGLLMSTYLNKALVLAHLRLTHVYYVIINMSVGINYLPILD